MSDEHNALADAGVQPTNADARRSTPPDGKPDHLQLAIKERDSAKSRARTAEAENALLREKLNALQPMRDSIAKSRIDGLLSQNVDPKMHTAALAVLAANNIDGFDAAEADVIAVLREANLFVARNTGGGNAGTTTEARRQFGKREITEDDIASVTRAAEFHSKQARGIDESGGVARHKPREPTRVVSSEEVEAIAKRISDAAREG